MKLAALFFLPIALAVAQAPDIFARLQAVFSNPADASLAVASLRSGNFVKLKQLLDRQSSQTPARRPELLALLGAVDFLGGDMKAAADHLTAAGKTSPLNDADSFTLAMALVKLGNDDRARAILTALLDKNPNRSLYVYWLGRLDYDQRRYDEAVTRLTRAVELDAKSARAWDSLGLAFDMQGQMQQALSAFEKASELNREELHPSPWPPHNLGYLLLRMNQPEAAFGALEESLRYEPSLAIANYHLGRTLEKLGRGEQAIQAYKQAVANDPGSTDACYSLAQLYRKLQRETEAEQMFAEYRRRKSVIQ
jgi:superkiller protein 3